MAENQRMSDQHGWLEIAAHQRRYFNDLADVFDIHGQSRFLIACAKSPPRPNYIPAMCCSMSVLGQAHSFPYLSHTIPGIRSLRL
jgi:hypothetical protein